MKMTWHRETRPADPAEFDPNNGTGAVRVLLPGSRLVQDADGTYWVEWAVMEAEPGDFPFFERMRQPRKEKGGSQDD